MICLSPALRYYLSVHQVNIYSNTFCRLDGLMAGALLALAVRSANFVPLNFVKRAWVVLLVSAPLALVIESHHARWIGFSVIAAASVSFVYLALFSPNRGLRALLTNRFLVYTGTISYGIYLLQKIPLDVVKAFHLDQACFSGVRIRYYRDICNGVRVLEIAGAAIPPVEAVLRGKEELPEPHPGRTCWRGPRIGVAACWLELRH